MPETNRNSPARIAFDHRPGGGSETAGLWIRVLGMLAPLELVEAGPFDPILQLPPINLPPMPQRQHEHHQLSILDFADNPEIADTVAP